MTLIDRLEAAETGDRTLDYLIAEHLGWTKFWSGVMLYLPPGEVEGSDRTTAILPEFSQSVDAALTLIPADGFWSITAAGDGKGFDAFVRSIPNNQPMDWTRAKTAPLALVIAALRARKER